MATALIPDDATEQPQESLACSPGFRHDWIPFYTVRCLYSRRNNEREIGRGWIGADAHYRCGHCLASIEVTPKRFSPAPAYSTLIRPTRVDRDALAKRPIVLTLRGDAALYATQEGKGNGMAIKNGNLRDRLEALSIVPVAFHA